MFHRKTLYGCVCLVALTAFGCAPSEQTNETPSSEPITKSEPPKEPEPATPGTIDLASGKYEPFQKPADGDEVVILETGAGRIVVRFFPDAAPEHVKNFKDLVRKGFYDGTKFHRTIPGFMVQGGDPNTKSGDPSTWGQGGPDHNVKDEFNPIPHKRGVLSMARTDMPNSAGSQFFIVVKDSNFLDNNYTVFGAVVEGMEVADKIVETPTSDNNGTVVPDKAIKLNRAKLATWPQR